MVSVGSVEWVYNEVPGDKEHGWPQYMRILYWYNFICWGSLTVSVQDYGNDAEVKVNMQQHKMNEHQQAVF